MGQEVDNPCVSLNITHKYIQTHLFLFNCRTDPLETGTESTLCFPLKPQLPMMAHASPYNRCHCCFFMRQSSIKGPGSDASENKNHT